jgi:toxin YoeB
MAKRVIWTKKAVNERIEIIKYWIDKTGSNNYSRKLETKFRETIRNISDNNYLGKATDIEGVRLSIVSHYLLFYEVCQNHIEILTLFDSRRNPTDIE